MLKMFVLTFLRMAFEKVLVYSHQKNLKVSKNYLVTGPCNKYFSLTKPIVLGAYKANIS